MHLKVRFDLDVLGVRLETVPGLAGSGSTTGRLHHAGLLHLGLQPGPAVQNSAQSEKPFRQKIVQNESRQTERWLRQLPHRRAFCGKEEPCGSCRSQTCCPKLVQQAEPSQAP
jgi:hypothetical protein